MIAHPARRPLRTRALAIALSALLALAAALTAAPQAAAQQGPHQQGYARAADTPRGGPPVTVMTRNLYLGADLTGLFAATDGATLVAAASQIWADVVASDFPARAELIADEIDAHDPLLIGLQEVSLFQAMSEAGAITIDFLQILLDALADEGLAYEAVSISPAFEGTLPAIVDPLGLSAVTLLDRDVVLARTDVPPAQLTVLDEQTGLFDAALTLPVLGAPLRIDRGWNAVDVRVRGRELRFVNTHLEAFDPGEVIRQAQAVELLAGPLATDLPVVLVGDLNSDAEADGLAYDLIVDQGGFADAWSAANPGDPGLTCCHDADLLGDLDLHSRIDLVLVTDGIRVRSADRVGVDPALRTPDGLWPSDHAGVVATVMVTAR